MCDFYSAGRIAHCEGPRPSFACPFIRVSFASATDADLVEGIKRLATVIKRFQQESAAVGTEGNLADGKGHKGPCIAASNGKSHSGHTANGNTENGNSKHGKHLSVQDEVYENEQMSLHQAVHTAADSQPEAC